MPRAGQSAASRYASWRAGRRHHGGTSAQSRGGTAGARSGSGTTPRTPGSRRASTAGLALREPKRLALREPKRLALREPEPPAEEGPVATTTAWPRSASAPATRLLSGEGAGSLRRAGPPPGFQSTTLGCSTQVVTLRGCRPIRSPVQPVRRRSHLPCSAGRSSTVDGGSGTLRPAPSGVVREHRVSREADRGWSGFQSTRVSCAPWSRRACLTRGTPSN